VHDADLDEPKQVDALKVVAEQNGKQAEPPAVLGGAFLPAFGGATTALGIFQPVGLIQEGEHGRNPLMRGEAQICHAALCKRVR
jgi:hypothetical protein